MPNLTRFAKTLWQLTRRTAQEYSRNNCSHMAAAISYYVLFSIIPLAIFLVSIFGMVVRDEQLQEDVSSEVVDFLDVEAGTPTFQLASGAEADIAAKYGQASVDQVTAELTSIGTPERQAEADQLATQVDAGESVTIAGRVLRSDQIAVRSDNAVIDTIRGVSDVSGALTIVGLVGMAWSASAMFGAVRKSLNIAWNTEVHRPLVQQKVLDLGMVLGLGAMLGLSVAGTAALRTFRELSDDALGPLSTGTGLFWSVLPFVLPAIFSFTVFLLLYRFVPNVETRFRDVLPGALLATVLFEALKNGYALYIANFNNFAGAYGALGGILLFLLWTYLSSSILLLGAEFAVEYPRVMRGDYATAPGSQSRPLRHHVVQFIRRLFVRDAEESGRAERPD
ncbi:MAG: YihY/virulence factor BrkB family protein [Dehalococcoidia bacterium]